MRNEGLKVALGLFVAFGGAACSAVPAASPDTPPGAPPAASTPVGGPPASVPVAWDGPPDFPGDKILVSPGLASTFDGRFRVPIPAAEVYRAAAGSRFATTERAEGESSTWVRVRDIRTGELVAEIKRTEYVSEVVLVDDAAYFNAGDLGVFRLSFADGSVAQATPPSSDRSIRGLLARSPTGRTIATLRQPVDEAGFASGEPRAIDVTSTVTGMTREVVSGDTNLLAITDAVVLTRNEFTIRGFSIKSGERLWEVSVLGTLYGYVTTDGATLVQPYFLDSTGWAIGLIDVQTGRVMAEYPYEITGGPSPEMSTDRYAVFPDLTENPRITYLDLRNGVAHERSWLGGAR